MGPGCALVILREESLAYDGHLVSWWWHSEANEKGRASQKERRRAQETAAMLSSCANYKDRGSSWLLPAREQTRTTCTCTHCVQCPAGSNAARSGQKSRCNCCKPSAERNSEVPAATTNQLGIEGRAPRVYFQTHQWFHPLMVWPAPARQRR